MPDSMLVWRKSRRACDNGSCVEVAMLAPGGVAVRDSTIQPDGPILQFTDSVWTAFVASLKRDPQLR